MTIYSDDTRWLVAAGELLRTTRLEQGITLDDVARETKIGKSQLAAIEDGDLDRLPAIAYVRGFVRVYAAFLGVSIDILSSAVSSSPGQIGHLSVVAEAEVGRSGRKLHRRWFAPLLLGGVVLFLVYFYQQQDRPLPLPPMKAPVAMTGPATPAIQPPVSSARRQDAALVETKMEGTVQDPPAPAEGAILKLKVNQDCWLNITIDDAVSQQYDLKAGDLIEWKGEKGFTLDIGNAGGIEGEFNGRPLKSFGEPGKRAHVVLSDQGI